VTYLLSLARPVTYTLPPVTLTFVVNVVLFRKQRRGECLVIPAGWFLQLSPAHGAATHPWVDMWVVESAAACRGAHLRPSIMHLNSKSPCSSSPASAAATIRNAGATAEGGSYSSFLKNKRARLTCDGEGTEAAQCMWLEKGWSTRLDLTQDWFSHNLPSWQHLFRYKVHSPPSPPPPPSSPFVTHQHSSNYVTNKLPSCASTDALLGCK